MSRKVDIAFRAIRICAIPFGGLGILSWACFITAQRDDILIYLLLFGLGFVFTLFGSILTVVSAITSLVKSKLSALVMTGVILNIVSLGMLVYSIVYIVNPEIRWQRRAIKMFAIHRSMEVYKQHHSGQLPDGSDWCDTLSVKYITAEGLTFTPDGKTQRNYALNANAQKLSEIPDDMVVIFESGPGWNLVGGKELLVGDDDKGGCWILYGGRGSRYVLPEDFNDLRWNK